VEVERDEVPDSLLAQVDLWERVLYLRSQDLGEDHPVTLGARLEYIASLAAARRHFAAIAEHERALTTVLRDYGQEHADALHQHFTLALALIRARHPHQAIPHLEAMVAVVEESRLEDDAYGLWVRSRLAHRLGDGDRDDLARAVGHFQRTLAGRLTLLSGHHPLARFARDQRDAADDDVVGFLSALTLYGYALNDYRPVPLDEPRLWSRDDIDPSRLPTPYRQFLEADRASDLIQAALSHYDRVAPDRDFPTPVDAGSLDDAAGDLVTWLVGAGRRDSAIAHLEHLLGVQTAVLGPSHPATGETRQRLDRLANGRGQP
jgi:hypothetical protein